MVIVVQLRIGVRRGTAAVSLAGDEERGRPGELRRTLYYPQAAPVLAVVTREITNAVAPELDADVAPRGQVTLIQVCLACRAVSGFNGVVSPAIRG